MNKSGRGGFKPGQSGNPGGRPKRHIGDLSREMLVRILTEPRDSIYSQFQRIFHHEGVELTVERKVFEQISEIAIEYKTGARSLRGIFEELIAPILFTVPDNPAIRKVGITSLFSDPAYVLADEVAARS